ncbi:MAG TPA: PsbP-related protein [Actinomycetota bacterium]
MRRSTLFAKRSSLCVVLAAAALFTACSNSDNGSSGASANPSAAATVPTNVSASASGSGQTFNGHGVSFQYPADWDPIQTSGESASQGSEAWSEAFGIDNGNFALVRQYNINLSITASNIDQHTSELTTQIQSLFTQAGGSMQSGPTKLTMGGFPALGYSGTAVTPQAVSVKTRIVLAFNGTTEYFVNCQSTGNDNSALETGCDQIVSTFAVA